MPDSADYVGPIDAAEAKQRREAECSHDVFEALAPLLIKYGSVMTYKAVREWMGKGPKTDGASLW